MSHPIKIGDVVPLFYLSPYKNVALYVRASIYNELSGALLATKDLTHISDGRYTDASFFMPDISGLEIRHDVYSDAGYSIPYDREGSIEERFHRLIVDPALFRNDELILIFNDNDSDELYMVFSDDNFNMNIGSDDQISFMFGDDNFNMTLYSDDLSITFHDC